MENALAQGKGNATKISVIDEFSGGKARQKECQIRKLARIERIKRTAID